MSQPVGGQYGLELQRPELYEKPVLPIDSRDLVSDIPYDDPTATEFGGVAGLIQPPPHVPTTSERLHQIYAIDPEDDGTRADSVAAPELDGNFGTKAN